MQNRRIQNLKDLRAWQEAVKLTAIVYRYTKILPESEKYNIKKHMEGCARNIPGNIAEGFGRYYYKETKQFYRIARGSLEELNSDNYLCLTLGYFTNSVYSEINNQSIIVGKLITGLLDSCKKIKPPS